MNILKRGALALLCALLLPACAAAEEKTPIRLVSELPCIEKALRSEPINLDPDAITEQYQWLDAASAVHPVCEALTDEKTGKLCLRLTGGIDYAYFPEATLSVSGAGSGRLSFAYDAKRDLFVCDENASDEALSKLEQVLKGEADSEGVSLSYAGDLHSRTISNAVVGCRFGIDPREGGIRSQFRVRYTDGGKTTHEYNWSSSSSGRLEYSRDGSPLRMQFLGGELNSYSMTFSGMDAGVTYTISYDVNGEIYGPDREGFKKVARPQVFVFSEADGKSKTSNYYWNFDEQIWEYHDIDKQVWQPVSEEDPGGGKLLSPYDERFALPRDLLYPEEATPAPASTPAPKIERTVKGRQRID